MDIMKTETIGDRIKKYRETLNISQATLAKWCGWSASRIGNYESNVRDVDVKTATVLAEKLGINPVTLMFGDVENNIDESYIGRVKEGSIIVKGEAIMGNDGSFEMDESFNGRLKFYSDDPNAFALKVKGDSMFPRINSGEFVVIEPKVIPCAGEEVFVRLKNGKNMIKKMEYHRDYEYRFTSINQEHRPITIDEERVDKVMFVAAIVKASRYVDVHEI